jgi:hypothetical protein
MFGPKAGGAWPAGTSLIGPQGPQGIQGIQGIQGPIGNTGTRGSLWYEGSGPPGTISGQLDNDNDERRCLQSGRRIVGLAHRQHQGTAGHPRTVRCGARSADRWQDLRAAQRGMEATARRGLRLMDSNRPHLQTFVFLRNPVAYRQAWYEGCGEKSVLRGPQGRTWTGGLDSPTRRRGENSRFFGAHLHLQVRRALARSRWVSNWRYNRSRCDSVAVPNKQEAACRTALSCRSHRRE